MPRRQRELAILRVEFGLGYDEIATETATPTAVARAETVNALAALIDALGTNAGTRRAA
jgi:DNA-directed RNA polymerase specialized sigma24 family protein